MRFLLATEQKNLKVFTRVISGGVGGQSQFDPGDSAVP